jgi:hypothetical protein
MQEVATVTSTGAVVTYDEGVFAIGGGTVGVEKVIEYDGLGIVAWVSEEMKVWAYQVASAASAVAEPAAHAPAIAPAAIPTGPGPEASRAKNPFYKKWWVWAGAAVVVLIIATSGARGGSSSNPASSSASSTSSPGSAKPAAPTPPPLKSLALVASAPERVEAASVNIVGSTTPSATVTVGGTPVPVDAGGQFTYAAALAPGANSFSVVSARDGYKTETRSLTVTRLQFAPLTARAFEVLAKNPDAQIGNAYIIYGEVTQFDAATGTDTFRADIGATKSKIQYKMADYDQNSMLTGDAATLADTVEGDCFQAKVICKGSFSYDTQIGGSTTVPKFEVVSIKRYGSTK